MNHSDSEITEISKVFFNSIKQMDEQENLRPEELPDFKKNHVKLLYPHKEEAGGVRKYLCCEACCAQPGRFCCCSSWHPGSDFVKFGLSICLYFKFLKHSIIFYIFFSMLAVLSCVVCYEISLQNNNNPLDNYSNFLSSTTYGAFASEHNKCQYSLLTNNLGIYTATFNLKCSGGTVNGFSSVLSNESLNSLYNCRNQRKKQENNDTSTNSSRYLLTQKKNCTTDNSECTITQTFNPLVASTSYTTISYTFQCLSNYYQIGSINQKSAYYFYFVVAVDLFFCLWFMFFLRSEIGAEKDQTAYFKMTQVSLDDFSIKINGFTTRTADQEFEGLLKAISAHFPYQNLTKSIASYTFAENQEMLTFYKDKFQVFSEVIDLIKQYYLADELNEKLTFQECHQKVFAGRREHFQEYKTKLTKHAQTIFEFQRRKELIEQTSEDNTSLLLVFDGVNKKTMVKSLIQQRCCSNNEIKVGNKFYTITAAPVPDMILWQNKYSWRKLRMTISWILTLAICLGSYLLFGYIQYKQSQLFSTYNYGIDCNVLYTPAQLNTVSTKLLSQPNYITCICKNQSLLDVSSSNNDYCATWKTQYRLYIIVPLLISLGIVIYNVIVSYIFRWMGYFEKHKFLIDEEISYTFKRAFLLVLNMGLIMILLNYNYRNSINLTQVSFIFLGKYDDFSADWYQSIGSIIVLTMIFNIATPIAEFIISFILKCLRKCRDTKCFQFSTTSKTKSEYLELYNDDIFPIGERYAYLIATFFITFSFSGVIPILIPISLISFVLLYFSDKLLIFKFYQTPKNFTPTIHKILLNVLIISLISHMALTSYFLTEPTLIASNSNISSPPATLIKNARVNSMITTIYIYPYLGLLALIIGYFALDIFCGSLKTAVQKCFCQKDEQALEHNQSVIIQDISFWNTLSKLQLETLRKVSNFSLEKYRLKQQGGINAIISKSDIELAATSYPMTMANLILENSVERLDSKARQYERDHNLYSYMRTILLGLPSYDFLIKKDKFSKNNLMLKIQTQLKANYKERIRNAQRNAQILAEPKYHSMKQNESATQIRSDVI